MGDRRRIEDGAEAIRLFTLTVAFYVALVVGSVCGFYGQWSAGIYFLVAALVLDRCAES